MAGTGHIAQPIVRGLRCTVLLVPGRGGEAVTEETQHFPPHTSRRPRRIFRAQSYPITQEMFNLILPTQVVWKSLRSTKTFNSCPSYNPDMKCKHESRLHCLINPCCPYILRYKQMSIFISHVSTTNNVVLHFVFQSVSPSKWKRDLIRTRKSMFK